MPNNLIQWAKNLTRDQQLLRWATIWPQWTWAEKWGAAVSLSVRGAGSPCNTMLPRQRPTSVPSSILIHVSCIIPHWAVICNKPFHFIQPFSHNSRTLQTGQTRQRSDSIGWSVLQTVAQKKTTHTTHNKSNSASILKTEKGVKSTSCHWLQPGSDLKHNYPVIK